MHFQVKRALPVLMLVGVMLISAGPAFALIRLDYTPVHLMRQSTAILRVELGPVSPGGECPVKIVKTIRGAAPEKLVLQAAFDEPEVREAWEGAFGGAKTASALLFRARFRATAAGNPDAGTPDRSCMGAVLVGTSWFSLFETEGAALRVAKDFINLKAVWAGGDETLQQLIEYAQRDPSTKVPVTAGPGWAAETKIATLEGIIYSCAAVELAPSSKPYLLVACDQGDRIFQQAAGGDAFEDRTAAMKIASKSRLAAWADFSGGGRLDLASWDGKTLRFYLQAKNGTFAASPVEMDLGPDCQRLTPLDVGKTGRAGLLVSGTVPRLLMPGGDGRCQVKPLPAAPEELLKALGPPGPCVAADFDGDGIVDIVQTFARGALLYRGKEPGQFDAPVQVLKTALGSKVADAFVGDFDGDGLPDIGVTSDVGCGLLVNRGGKKFEQKYSESGEIPYIAKPDAFAGIAWDVNLDGREGILLLYPQMNPHIFFNRGFRCFGHAITLDMDSCTLICRDAIKQGQQAGTVADLRGDGVPGLVVATAEGELWLLSRPLRKERPLGLTLAVHNSVAGPVRVVAYDGKRCLGARGVAAGAPVFFPKAEEGPLTVTWQFPGAAAVTKEFVVEKPLRFELPVK